MEEKFVPYELALKLKELGFNEPCINFWYQSGTLNNSVPIYEAKDWYHSNSHLNAPLWQQVFDFFREKYGVDGWVVPYHSDTKMYCYIIEGIEYTEDLGSEYETYEEARLACLEKLIEVVEKQKKSN